MWGGVKSSSYQVVNQHRSVSGTISDESGEPMIGVSVQVQGTTSGTITDFNGKFSLDNLSENAILVISYMGYQTQTIKVGNQQNLSIKMKTDNQLLDEVVVIGFGTVKKRDLTGAVSSVKTDVILQTPTTSLTKSLQGRIAGLDVNGSTLRIRGNRSINGSNDPLVIIDGVQGGSMGDLNPSDVEAIDVLKDASSTAIYGSQGANGVIIITTKKAKPGKMSVSYDGYVSFGFRSEHPDYRSGENYYTARKIAAQNAGQWNSEADDQSLFGTPEAYQAFMNGDWTNYEKILKKDITFGHKHTLTVSGGTEKTSARFSVGYSDNSSSWKGGGGSERYILRSNIDHKIYDWISAGVNFQLTHSRSETSPYEKSSTSGMQLGKPYDEDGNLVIYPLGESGYVNPLVDNAENKLYSEESYNTNVVANGYLDIKPFKGLTIRSQFNAHLTNSSSGSYKDKNQSTEINSTKRSAASMTKKGGTSVEWNNVVTYNFSVLEDHHFGVTALTAWRKSISDSMTGTSYNQMVANNLWWNLGAGSNPSLGSDYTQTQNFSYAGRVNYDYKGRYLFTASIRYDGASVLADGNKWASFPSAAFAWRVSDESFMQWSKNWLDDMKFRVTYGVTGNSGIKAYGTQSGVSPSQTGLAFQDQGVTHYAYNSIIGNTDTKWELSKTIDVGLDLTLLNGRINMVVDYYDTHTSDLLLLRSLPTSSGNDGQFQLYQNIGSTRNRGIEFSLNTVNIQTKDFRWNSTLTFSKNKEEIVDLIDGTDIQLTNKKEEDVLLIGHPIKSYRTYIYDGIYTSADAEEAGKMFKDKDKTQPFKVGEIRVKDLNGDNVIDEDEDICYLGSTSPDWFAGFNNEFNYQNFDLTVYMYCRWGHWGSNPASGFDPSTGGGYVNFNYWVKDVNEGGDLPELYANRKFFDYKGYQSLSYCDQSFFKIKRISLGYSLPAKFARTLHMERARIYATVTDPFYWVKSHWRKERDPEGLSRSLVFGLNIVF